MNYGEVVQPTRKCVVVVFRLIISATRLLEYISGAVPLITLRVFCQSNRPISDQLSLYQTQTDSYFLLRLLNANACHKSKTNRPAVKTVSDDNQLLSNYTSFGFQVQYRPMSLLGRPLVDLLNLSHKKPSSC